MTDSRAGETGQNSEDVLWHVSSVLLGGPFVWGGIGYLIGRLTGWEWLLPVGVVVGFVGSFVIAYARYFSAEPSGPPGRSWSTGPARPGAADRSERSS